MLKALIFDVDGTLADTERDGHRVAFNEAFAEEGLHWYWDAGLYGRLLKVAGGVERMQHYARHHLGTTVPDRELDLLLRRLHAAKTRRYVQRVADGVVQLRPGIARLVHEARAAGLRLAIATTTSPENVTALLEATLGPGSTRWFEAIGTAREAPVKKPDPQVYRWVLERLNIASTEALAFEDTGIGLRAARGAGLGCIVTPTPYSEDDDFSGALRVLPDLDHAGPDGRAAALTLPDLHGLHRPAARAFA